MKFFENVEEYMKNSNMTREEKTAFIKAAAELYEQQVDKEYRRNIRDYRLGAALEIGSAAIPGVVGTKMASKIAPKVIQKTIGRKLVNDTLSGAINSGLSGGVYGFGEGLAENKNPFINSAQKATEGLIAGGLVSAPISKLQNNIRAKDTLSINEMRKHWGIAHRQASGDPKKAIETLMTYQRGFVPNVINKNGIGNFDIPWGDERSGLGHALMRRANQKNFDLTKFVNELPNTISEGVVTSGSILHPETKNIENLNANLAIAPRVGKYNVDRQWMPTAFPQNKTARKRLGDWTPSQNISSKNGTHSISELLAKDNINDYFLKNNPPKWVNSQTATLSQAINNNIQNNIPNFDSNIVITARGQNQQSLKYGNKNQNNNQRQHYITKDTPDTSFPTTSRGAIESANNIIPNSISDFNPPKWVNSKTSALGQAINNNIQNNIPNFDSNTVITSRGKNQQIPKYDKIFTPEEIGEMKPDEYSKNEKVINEQIKQGLIAPVTYRKQNYTGYKNPVSGDNKIFTQEEIGNLTKEEFNKHEKEIQGQWGSIGIPSESEMSSSGAIYVEPYTRSDGVQVKGHYRSR